MQRQPYIYTMPEAFLEDESVPARWKVLAVVQGFWINGSTMFASNEWIQKKLGYSERQVQYALSELEKMDLISRKTEGKSRLILPGGCNRTAPGGATRLHPMGEAGLHHNTVSINTERNFSAPKERARKVPAESRLEVEIDDDGNEVNPAPRIAPKKSKESEVIKEIVRRFQNKCVEKGFPRPIVAGWMSKQIRKVLNESGLTHAQARDLMDEWFETDMKDADVINITFAYGARNINNYKVRNNVM